MTPKNLTWAIQRLQEDEKAFGQVIQEPVIPGHLLHCFACDWAVRVLQMHRNSLGEPAAVLWKAVQMKRAWLEGRLSPKELPVLWMNLVELAWEIRCEEASEVAMITAWSVLWDEDTEASARLSALRVCEMSTRFVIRRVIDTRFSHIPGEHPGWNQVWTRVRKAEEALQCQYLLSMLQTYQETQGQLLHTLTQRAEKPKWEQWFSLFEESLFE